MISDDAARTHEPSLRELTAELDGLRALMCAKLKAISDVMDERDRRYEVRFDDSGKAVVAALSSQEKLTAASFAASEKAITKAEHAQSDYNVRSNEFRGQLDDQAKMLMPRTETVGLIKSNEDKVWAVKNELNGQIERLAHTVGVLADERKQFYTRDAHDEYAKGVQAAIGTANLQIMAIQTRSVTWTAAIGIAFIVLNIVLHFWPK